MGTNDLVKETRARALHNRIAVVPWLAMTIVAARAYGLDVLDGVYNDFQDDDGFREECEHGRALGMDGKTLIHPSQVAPVQRGVLADPRRRSPGRARSSPPSSSRRTRHKGVITVEGRMVELLHVEMARRTVAIAEAIEAMKRAEEEWF